ncbi:FAD-dependent monooxygenase [Amycolatopsis jiangsuensis]|uniref:2-polyprenyl-6-methoxyphenol hydroxylase-like FAD-dependent oxidoreductase n=1 Tax=Amycolatopsis jiangsuensis TaxID=1181879 RepID=A0A840J312_9PSEU|nr:FAD-dependent monooxygenase [Amycolatopsis jiangsuensis]MBB4689446.1 2-polyprenyl-6-methoxyphenol hydroxylase-like FAD-dependent oxidoreductase [Amycolatopsis jiangsuensis]
MTTRIPVLICGGGIAGLTAALLLHREGVQSMVVERHPTTSPQPKARRFNSRSTEVFRLLGLEQEVAKASAPLAAFTGMLTGPTLAEATWPEISEGARAHAAQHEKLRELSPAPSVLCPQDALEPVLRHAAEERGVLVRFSTELVSFTQDSTGVIATLRQTTGDSYEVTADYLIGADGARSPVRTALGVLRSGHGHLADNLDLCFRADLTELVRDKPFNLCQITNPVASGAFVSVNGTDRWLFSTSDFAGSDTLDAVAWRELLRTVVGVPDLEVELLSRMHWESAMHVADRYRAGRVLLAGDAAHVMPPLAAAGANTAVGDVANLAWKLAAVLGGTADPALLDTYHAERYPVGYATAEFSSMISGHLGTMVASVTSDDGPRFDPSTTLFGLQYDEGAFVPDGREPAPVDHYAPAGRPGTRIPHAWLGPTTSPLDLAGPGLVLLAGPACTEWTAQAERLGIKHRTIADPHWLSETGLPADGALLLRPDAIVAWHSRADVSLAEAMGRVLCTTAPAPV